MRRRLLLTLLTVALMGVFTQSALASGEKLQFAGGTAAEQATVRAALDASSFDWGLLPQAIVVHVGAYGSSYSTYGNVYVDASLLESGEYAWGVVQHEFGHQVDFFLLDDAKRSVLQQRLGGADWCYTTPGLAHSDHGCERFASELAWAYWQSPQNCMNPGSTSESGWMPVTQFRALLSELIGMPTTVSRPAATKAFAPAVKPKPKPKRR
jgi:hypothetical protein